MEKMFLGIDIGGTAVKIGHVSETGDILCSGTYSVDFDGYKTAIIDSVILRTKEFLFQNSIDISRLEGIGVSATGQIDSHSGSVIGSAGHINKWLNTPIAELINNAFGVPVTVANDANCAVLGEKWKGAAKDYQNIVMVTIGTGIGGGIIVNNKLLLGKDGIAGEIGHFCTGGEKRCSCGNEGCFETYASVSALVRKVKQQAGICEFKISEEKIDGRYIFAELAKGNTYLQDIVDGWIDEIAKGLVGLVHLFNPEVLLIGGGVSEQHNFFMKPLEEKVRKSIMPCFEKNLKIQPAILGNFSGVLGAVYYFLNYEGDKQL